MCPNPDVWHTPAMCLLFDSQPQSYTISHVCVYVAAFSVSQPLLLNSECTNQIGGYLHFLSVPEYFQISEWVLFREVKLFDWGQWTRVLCWITGSFLHIVGTEWDSSAKHAAIPVLRKKSRYSTANCSFSGQARQALGVLCWGKWKWLSVGELTIEPPWTICQGHFLALLQC